MAQLSSSLPIFYLCRVCGIIIPLFRYCLLTFSIPFCSDLQAHIRTGLMFAESTLRSQWQELNQEKQLKLQVHK